MHVKMRTCVRSRKLSYCCKNKKKTPLKNNMCTGGPDDEQYIIVQYTEDQAGQDIRDEDVIQAENLVWYTKAEIKTWRDKTTAGIPTYGNCVSCYWGGPVGLECTHCDGKITKSPAYQVHESRGKILDSRWVARYFERGHDVAKADRKHRWIRTGTVQLPSFRKFERMLDEGEKFVESNK